MYSHAHVAASAGGVFCATQSGGVARLVPTPADAACACFAPDGDVRAYACTALALLADGDVCLHYRDSCDGGASLRAVHRELCASAVQCGKRSCFVLAEGALWVSGANNFGELGLGSYARQVARAC